jgi:hypothetical protein
LSRKTLLNLLCQRHRTSPSSRPRFLPRQGRLDCHPRCLKCVSLLRVHQGRPTRCPPATMTIQRPLILVGPCFGAFVLKFVSLEASSPPSPLRADAGRWAAFQSDSRHLRTGADNVVAKPFVQTASRDDITVRLAALRTEDEGEGTR